MAPKDLPGKDDFAYPHLVETEKCEVYKEDKNVGGSKGSISLELGTYQAAKIPLIVTILGWIMGYFSTLNDTRHPISQSYPLLNSYPEMMTIVVLYIFGSLVWGPRYMKNKEPFKVKNIIMTYNVIQVAVCLYMFYEIGVSGWFGSYNWICQPMITNFPEESRMVAAAYLFYLTKILDFADTLFFILNKKWSHISVLHVVHHSNMFVCLWYGIRYVPTGHLTFLGFVNSFIHVVMYTYYLLAALGPKAKPYLWWKKYLTTMQLIQFVSVFIHSTQALITGCKINRGIGYMTLFYSVIYFVLFLDFYFKAYKNTKKMVTRSPLYKLKKIAMKVYTIFARNPENDSMKADIDKTSVYCKLGDYESTKIPLVVALFGFMLCYNANYNKRLHPVTEGLPLQGNMATMLAVALLYILSSFVWGPRLMMGREAFNVKKILRIYNLFQVILCSYMFYEFGVSGWFGSYDYFCEDVNYSLEPMEVRMSITSYIYYLSKILDFADTAFFILTKKWTHLSALHVVHHSSMFITLWFGVRYTPRGQMTFLAWLNSFIHVVMYTYYLLASLGPSVRPYLWWKKYLTTIQLVQFVVVFLHAFQSLFTGCTFSKGMTCVTLFYSITFFVLFMDFYQKSYRHARKVSISKESIAKEKKSDPIQDYLPSLSEFKTLSQTLKASTCIADFSIHLDKTTE